MDDDKTLKKEETEPLLEQQRAATMSEQSAMPEQSASMLEHHSHFQALISFPYANAQYAILSSKSVEAATRHLLSILLGDLKWDDGIISFVRTYLSFVHMDEPLNGLNVDMAVRCVSYSLALKREESFILYFERRDDATIINTE